MSIESCTPMNVIIAPKHSCFKCLTISFKVGDVTYADAHRTRKNEGCVEFANYKDLEKGKQLSM